jgi:hypothetical protein
MSDGSAEVVEGKVSWLVGCYVFLTLLAVCFLVLVSYPLHSAGAPQGLIAERSSDPSQLLVNIKTAVLLLRERMHNTWLFLYVFLAVWVTVLVWGFVVRRRLELPSGLREFYFMGWISLSVFSTAVLYGMGTNGIMARRFPKAAPAADALAIGFVLALPVIAWARLQRQRTEQDELEEQPSPYRRVHSSLGLFDDESSVRLLEKPEVRAVAVGENPFGLKLVPAEPPSMLAITTTDRLIQSAEMPAANSQETANRSNDMDTAIQAGATTAAAKEKGIDGFRDHLNALNQSWGTIEATGREIEQWFDQQRQLAIDHLEKHPGLRGQQAPLNPSGDFLNERVKIVDAEWAKIRKSALEISRWFGDVPAEAGRTEQQ